jgi:hypothetical protein
MRILPLSIVALATSLALLFGDGVAQAGRFPDEPQTSTIRIRLRGPTLRVRCRGGDCVISIVGTGTSYAVSVTRTRNGVPFTFARTVENPTNVAIETAMGTDSITVTNLAIPGFLRIFTGAGDDTLDLSNIGSAAKATIDTGPGNDVVHLAPGTFGDKFRLSTHGGDDDVTVTGSGLFASKAGFDGGPGTDTLSTQSAPFTVPPAIRGFEP